LLFPVLSVIFQSYSQASQRILSRSRRDKEDALQLAFESICTCRDSTESSNNAHARNIHVRDLMKVLMICRSHYPVFKIDALLSVVDPTSEGVLSYNTFRIRVPQALQISLRSSYERDAFVGIIEKFSMSVAILNCLFVVLLSSSLKTSWLEMNIYFIGSIITAMSFSEITMRLNPWKIFNKLPKARLSPTFDVLSIISVLISGMGLLIHFTMSEKDDWNDNSLSIKLLFIGRTMDMMRCMKLFKIYRDIIHRCEDVYPALIGPMTLLFCSMHIFCYIGMYLWKGKVVVGSNSEISYLYDLNNFNGYSSGLVTTFQIIIVNDWNQIANVFLAISKPYVVYTFFVAGNLVGASILLNVLIAFFVGAFVTKYEKSEKIGDGKLQKLSLGVQTKKSTRMRRHNSNLSLRENISPSRHNSIRSVTMPDFDESIRSASVGDLVHELEMFQREGYEKVLETVVGGVENEISDAKEACSVLKAVEKLTPSSETIGYLVSCYKSLSRFANGHFEDLIRHFGQEASIHRIVSEMHTELIGYHSLLRSENITNITTPDTVRRYVAQDKRNSTLVLELSATTLCKEGSSLALFVVKVVDKKSLE